MKKKSLVERAYEVGSKAALEHRAEGFNYPIQWEELLRHNRIGYAAMVNYVVKETKKQQKKETNLETK